MTFLWFIVGVLSVFLFPQSSDEYDQMFDAAWKAAAVIAGFSIFAIFAYDRAPSSLNWTPATFVWAVCMVGSGWSLASSRAVDEETADTDM